MSATTIACATVVIVILLSSGYTDCALPLLNPRKSVYSDVEKVCFTSYRTLYKLFSGLNMEGSFVENGLTVKPAEVPEESPCYGMEGTCCLPNEEKAMELVVELENHQNLQTILEDRLQSCNKLGRHTERSLYYTLEYGKQIFDKEISNIVGVEIPKELSKKFFQFLFRFVHVLDFCQLTNEIELLMKAIYKFVIDNTATAESTSKLLDVHCAEEFQGHFIDTWYNSSVNSLLKSFNVMRLISESYQLTQTLVTDLKQHKFNRQCITGLFKLRYCSYCVGNHYDLPVCDGHCINTFRGCMVDMYELLPHFSELEERLQTIAQIANSELVPIRFVQSSMIEFVHFTRHLKKVISQPENVVNRETCTINDDSIVSHIENNPFYIRSSFSDSFDGEKANLKDAIKKDMLCYSDIKAVLSELDENMCDINPKHLKYIRNRNCWNGTHSKGSYNHPLAGKERNDQLNNPAFKRHPIVPADNYIKQILQMNRLIHEISQTSEYYECIKTDDEDCNLFVLECKVTKTTTGYEELQSGSGSGSGSGFREQSSDNEAVSQSILLQLGTPRRYLDIMTNERTKPTTRVNNNTETTTNNNNDNTSVVYTSSNDTNNDNTTIVNNEVTETTITTTKIRTPTITTTTTTTTTANRPLPSNNPPQVPPPQKQGSGTSTVVYSSLVLFILYSLVIILIV